MGVCLKCSDRPHVNQANNRVQVICPDCKFYQKALNLFLASQQKPNFRQVSKYGV